MYGYILWKLTYPIMQLEWLHDRCVRSRNLDQNIACIISHVISLSPGWGVWIASWAEYSAVSLQCIWYAITGEGEGDRLDWTRGNSKFTEQGAVSIRKKNLSPIKRKWLYVINLNFFVWRHECHKFLLNFWLKQIFVA